jgi:hypothetical protein
MNLTVFVDNNTIINRCFQGRAVSYFIECEGRNYLFDGLLQMLKNIKKSKKKS